MSIKEDVEKVRAFIQMTKDVVGCRKGFENDHDFEYSYALTYCEEALDRLESQATSPPMGAVPDAFDGVIAQVKAELVKATTKFPTWPTRGLDALAVLGEEYGELNKEVLQMTYEPHKTSRDEIRKEAIQTAAMSLRFLASLDRYDYSPADQHSQESPNV